MRRNRFVRGMVLGMGLAYFLDPRLGRRRRHVGRDWTLARAKGGARALRRRARYAGSQAYGRWQRLRHLREAPKPQPDDATLAHKVETTIFRDHDVPKGQILVNAEHGVVYLRGEVPHQSMLDALVDKARAVQGVRAVESLLHLPGEPAPTHQA
jgi:osmotically-inducible protein OsmY